MRWAVAVTAAPRDGAFYLGDTVDSIRAAGWPDGIVYAEPGTPDCLWPMVYSDKASGPWPQFQRAMLGCLAGPCDAVAVFQDDCLVARGCRRWLESEMESGKVPDSGIVSLYSCQAAAMRYAKKQGWFQIPAKPRSSVHGAVAIVLTRFVADMLAADIPRPDARASTDYRLEVWCRDNGLPVVQHHPSLVRHVGKVSAVRPKRGRRRKPSRKLSRWRQEGEYVEDCRELGQ